jgi:cellulose synthase/poly-beta-1,6-N-acetylglucosamine synthase-like glycosyltransferase
MLVALFWLSIAAIVYHHIGYPILLRIAAKAIRRRQRLRPPTGLPAVQYRPTITIIVPAHNEAAVIERKIENMASLDYPNDKVSVVIAMDGCTDKTRHIAEATILRLASKIEFKLFEYHRNIGKVGVLNDQISIADADIVALSDASAIVGADALLKAIEHFAEPDVGVVCGRYSVDAAGSEGERAYWRYQNSIKADEADLGAPMGAHGAFYLFRREAWSPLPADTINDDFILPMSILLKGYRVAYDPTIVVDELEPSLVKQGFSRRVRIGAGNLQQLLYLKRLADPRLSGISFVFLSGKALRALLPFLLLIACGSTLLLAAAGHEFYRYLLLLGIAVFAVAITDLLGVRWKLKVFSYLSYIVQGYFASALGALMLLIGKQRYAWSVSRAGKRAAGEAAR